MTKLFSFQACLVAIAALTGCAAPPPTPAYQLTGPQLCAELGHAMTLGQSDRVAEVSAEGDRRHAAGTLGVDEGTCQALAQTGANAVAQEQAAAAQQQAAWAAIGQMGQQMQQQQAQAEQTQAINNVASGLRNQNVTLNRGYGW